MFSDGVKKKATSIVYPLQELKKTRVHTYKAFNSMALKLLNKSIIKKDTLSIVSGGVSYLIKSEDNMLFTFKEPLIKSLKSLFFTLLAIKINNNVYNMVNASESDVLSYSPNIASNSLILNEKLLFEIM